MRKRSLDTIAGSGSDDNVGITHGARRSACNSLDCCVSDTSHQHNMSPEQYDISTMISLCRRIIDWRHLTAFAWNAAVFYELTLDCIATQDIIYTTRSRKHAVSRKDIVFSSCNLSKHIPFSYFLANTLLKNPAVSLYHKPLIFSLT